MSVRGRLFHANVCMCMPFAMLYNHIISLTVCVCMAMSNYEMQPNNDVPIYGLPIQSGAGET